MNKYLQISVPIYFFKNKHYYYDHPIQIDHFQQKETLTRLIISIDKNLNKAFKKVRFIIVYGKESEELSNNRIERVLKMTLLRKTKNVKNVEIYVFSLVQFKKLTKNNQLINKCISNIKYGNIRNLQLLTHLITNTSFQVNLDDDEIIQNNTFFTRIKENQNKINQSTKLKGVGGFYIDNQGNPDILSKNDLKLHHKSSLFHQKEIIMQMGTDFYQYKKYSESVGAIYGGLNIMHKDLSAKINYDPNIRRGEDIDFVLHAMFENIYFGFDAQWAIIHKPPGVSSGSHFAPNKEKIKKDILRFIYQKMKFEMLTLMSNKEKKDEILINTFPYPGFYLMLPFKYIINNAQKYLKKGELNSYLYDTLYKELREFFSLKLVWNNITKEIKAQRRKLLTVIEKV